MVSDFLKNCFEPVGVLFAGKIVIEKMKTTSSSLSSLRNQDIINFNNPDFLDERRDQSYKLQ